MSDSLIERLKEAKEQVPRASKVDLSLLLLHRDAILSTYSKSGLGNTFVVLKEFIPNLSKRSLSNWIYRNKQHKVKQNKKEPQSTLVTEITPIDSIAVPDATVERNKIDTTTTIPDFGGEDFIKYRTR